MDRTAGNPRRPRELARVTARSRPPVPHPPRAVARPRRVVLALRCGRHQVLRTVRHVRLRDPRPRSDRLHLRDLRLRDHRVAPTRARPHPGRDRLRPVRRRHSRPRLPVVHPAQVSKRPAGPTVVRRRTASRRNGRHRPVNLHGRRPRSPRRRPTRPRALRRYPPSRRRPVRRRNRTTVRKVAQEPRPGSVEPVSVRHRKERTIGSSRRISRRPICPDAELRCRRT